MEYQEHYDQASMTHKISIVIGEHEKAQAKFTPLDKALLNDMASGDDITVADRLLVLEMIARRIEESSGGNIDGQANKND